MKTHTDKNETGKAINAFIRFNKGLLRMPLRWRLWVGFLVTLNFIAPLIFIEHLEAQFVLGAFFASMLLMTALTGLTGFTRLVGMGHFVWIPLFFVLGTRLPGIPADSAMGIWIRVLIFANAVSLVIDASDALRYLAGDRTETVSVS